jgi:hypothetical protein
MSHVEYPPGSLLAKPTSSNLGKLAVLAMFALAFMAAGFAWWWNFHRGQKCLALYGPDAALLIRTANDVELIELSPDSSKPEDRTVNRLVVGGRTFLLHRVTTISEAKGLIHARTSIVDDTSFLWDAEADESRVNVQFAVRFWSGDRSSRATVAFDFDCQRLWHVESGKSAMLIPKVAEGWKSYLTRQAAAATPLEPARTAPSE